jgi:hypothetical protein
MANPKAFLPGSISVLEPEPEGINSVQDFADPQDTRDSLRKKSRMNFERTLGGSFNEIETRAAMNSGDELAWKKRYTTSFHISEQLGIQPLEIARKFDKFHKIFFEHDDQGKSYGSLLAENGKSSMIVPVEPTKEVGKSVVRATSELLLGGASGAASVTGFAEEAGNIQQFNRQFQSSFAANPKVLQDAAKTRGQFKQVLNPAWLMTGGTELAVNMAVFVGGGVGVVGSSRLVLGAKAFTRLSPTVAEVVGHLGASSVLTVSEALIETGSTLGAIQDGEQRKIMARTLKYIDSLTPEQRKSISGKALIRAANQFSATMLDTGDKETASNAASEVFARNLLVLSIFNAVSLGFGSLSGKLLLKSIQGKALKTAAASGGSAAVAAVGEIEGELAQNDISRASIIEALTGNAVDINLFDVRSVEALTGDDPDAFDAALAAGLMSSRSGIVRLLVDVKSAKSYHAAEVLVNEAITNLRKGVGVVEVDVLLDKLDNAPLLKDKIAILKDKAKEEYDKTLTNFQKDESFNKDKAEAIEDLADAQGISLEEAKEKVADTDFADEENAAAALAAEPKPTTPATVADLQKAIDESNVDFGDTQITPVQSFTDIPDITDITEVDLEQNPFTDEELQEFKDEQSNASNINIIRNEIIQAGGIKTSGFKELLGIPVRFRGKDGKAFDEVMKRAEELGLYNPQTESEEVVINLFKGAIKDKLGFSKAKFGGNEGVFIDRNGGEIFLIADNITTERIAPVIAHELLHAGLRLAAKGKSKTRLVKDVKKLMAQLFDSFTPAQIKSLSERYDVDLSTRTQQLIEAEEFLARIAEDPKADPNILQKIYSIIRQFLRDRGINIEFSDSDLRAIIAESKAAVTQQTLSLSPDVAAQDVRFSKAPQKVVDAAIKARGITTDIREAGYILPDGRLLDFSANLSGERVIAHGNINLEIEGKTIRGESALEALLNAGAIRMGITPREPFVQLLKSPTAAQFKVLKELGSISQNAMSVDIGDIFRTSLTIENPKKIEGLIKRHFAGEDVSDIRFSKAPPVKSKAFKEWFGDSKVLDDAGNPLRVFHGTHRNFDIFDRVAGRWHENDPSNAGLWFSSSDRVKEFYGPIVREVFLNIESPLIFRGVGAWKQFSSFIETEGGVEEFRRKAALKKHDGVFLLEDRVDGLTQDIYIAFDSNQIKETTNENPSTSPDIRFSLTPSQKNREKIAIARLIRLAKLEKDPVKRRAEGLRLLNKDKKVTKEELQVLPFEFGFSPEKMEAAGNNVVEKIKQVTVELIPRKPGSFPDPKVSAIRPPIIDKDTVNAEAPVEDQEVEPVSAENIEAIIKDTKQSVLAEMKKLRNLSFEGSKPFIAAYKSTMIRALQKANHELVYTRAREIILKKIRNIEAVNTEKQIDSRVANVVQDINRSRQRDDVKKLMAKVERILGARKIWELDSRTKERTAKPIDSSAKRRLKLIRNVYKRGKLHIDAQLKLVEDYIDQPIADNDTKKIEALFETLKKGAPALKDSFYRDKISFQDVVLTYFTTLTQYGALQDRTPLQVGEAIESIQDQIDGGILAIDELRQQQRDQDGARLLTLLNTLDPRNEFKFKQKGKFDQLATSVFLFDHRLNDMMRHGTIESQAAGEALINQMSLERSAADNIEETEKRLAFEALTETLEFIYKTDARTARNELERPLEKYRKYSKKKHPRELSKANLIQIFVTGAQEDYKTNFENAQRNGKYYEDLTAELTEQDFALINWLMDWHEDARPAISKVNLRVTGLPVVSPAYNYMPAATQQLKERLNETHTSTSVMIKRYTERVQHQKDIQEDVSVLNLWAETVRDNAHFKARAEIDLELTRIFGANALQEEIAGIHGDHYLGEFIDHATDVVAGGYPATSKIKVFDDLRAMVTLTTLALNAGSMIKQASSMVTMGLEIGLKDTARHFSTILSPEGIAAMKIIVASDHRKNRFAGGFDEGTKNAFSQLSDFAIFRFLQKGMITISTGDIFPSLLIGQGIYRDYIETHSREGMAPDVLQQKALDHLFLIVNRTQSSNKIENQPLWTRRWGTAGRLFGQFKSSVAELLSHEIVAIRKLIDNHPDKRSEAINALLILHVLMPASFTSAGILWSAILGEDLEADREAKKAIINMVIGPWSGLIVAGAMTESAVKAFILDRPDFWTKILPIEKAKEQSGTIGLLLRHLVTLDMEKALGNFIDLMTSNIPLFRDMRRLYKNHLE